MCWAQARDNIQQLDWNQNWFMCFALPLKPERVGVRLLRLWLSQQRREVCLKHWKNILEIMISPSNIGWVNMCAPSAARPQPASRPSVPQEEVQARRVLLSWEPGSDGLSPVRYYTVQYRELPDSNWTVHSASVSHETNSYIVDR